MIVRAVSQKICFSTSITEENLRKIIFIIFSLYAFTCQCWSTHFCYSNQLCNYIFALLFLICPNIGNSIPENKTTNFKLHGRLKI